MENFMKIRILDFFVSITIFFRNVLIKLKLDEIFVIDFNLKLIWLMVILIKMVFC